MLILIIILALSILSLGFMGLELDRLFISYKKLKCPHCESILQRSVKGCGIPEQYEYACTSCKMHSKESFTFHDQYDELKDALISLNQVRLENNLKPLKIIPMDLAKKTISYSINYWLTQRRIPPQNPPSTKK